jgi:mono/diheme cytochrome c family protein
MTTRILTFTIAAAAFAPLMQGCGDDNGKPKPDASTTDGPRDQTAEGPGDGAAGEARDGASDGGQGEGGQADGGALTERQAYGKYLIDNVVACGDCHTPRTPMGAPDMSKYLAGDPMFVATPGGNLGSANLTSDATGLRNRTDAEIKAMFMDGKRPTATGEEALNPIMPYYVFHNMKTEDADAIVAYLRVVPAVANSIPRRAAAFDLPMPAAPIDMNGVPLPETAYPQREAALRGRYLTSQVGLCIECHTPRRMTGPTVLDPTKYFQGGEDFSAFFASTLMIKPVSKNLTSDMTTGLGTWTVSDVVTALKMGRAKDGTGICPPMPAGPMGAYGGLKDQDVTDIAHYIKSLPAAVSLIPDMCVFPPMMPGDGGTDGGGADGASDGSATDSSGN